MSADTPSIEDLLLEAGRAAAAKVHTCLPGIVLSYDATNQRVTVQPAVRGRYKDPSTSELVTYQMPVIANVPVAFPSAAGVSITWPISKGDPVTLVFAERSLDEWKTVGGDDATPRDVRRHDLSDAIAIPGGRPFSDVVPAGGVDATAMVLRAAAIKLGDATATEAVMLGTTFESQLNTWLGAFTTFLASLNTAVSVANVAAAATAMQVPHATFVAQMLAGHQSTTVKAK